MDGDGSGGLSPMSSMGFMDPYFLRMNINQYIATGNPFLDTMIVSMALAIFAKIASLFSQERAKNIWQTIRQFLGLTKSEDSLNQVLIKSSTYRTDGGRSVFCDYRDEIQAKNLNLIKAFYWFLNKNLKGTNDIDLGINFTTEDYDDQTYRNYELMIRPNDVVEVNGFEITVEHSSSDIKKSDDNKERISNDDNNKNQTEKHFNQVITIKSEKTVEEINNFITEVWKDYVDFRWPKVERSTKKEKWFYMRKNKGYVRYRLKSNVVTNDIFFPEKEKLFDKISQFIDDKLRISRFTILLHGKPGGGKTSFIKALHNHTGRHIVSVKLTDFDSIESLMELFHDPYIKDEENDDWFNVPIEQRIYLLEDVDAAGDIVLKRKTDKKDKKESNNKDNNNENNDNNDKSNKDQEKKDDDEDSEDGYWKRYLSTLKKGSGKGSKMGKYSAFFSPEPSISLADILNLFDGVLELNGCIIVMTTNHIEKLDPALIRDGRVTYKVELKEITIPDMKNMINKYFNSFDPSKEEPKIDKMLDLMEPIMPCSFERLIRHAENIDEVYQNILNHVNNQDENISD